MSETMKDLRAVSSMGRPSDLNRPLGDGGGMPQIGSYEQAMPGTTPSTAEERLARYFIERALSEEGEKVNRIALEIKAAVDAMGDLSRARVEVVLDGVCIMSGADIVDLQIALRQAVEAAGGNVVTFDSKKRD